MQTISPQRLHELFERDRNLRLVDVRTPAEFGEVHVPFAENRPLESLDAAAVARDCSTAPNAAIYIICQKGGRGANACGKLLAAGLPQVVNVEGGTEAWVQAGLPVVRGQRTIFLERQVRIAAGSLVLLGSLLGFFVHPYWIAVSAFVGAGLVFAGLTDTCGMGLVLARMPWNQVASSTSTRCSTNGS